MESTKSWQVSSGCYFLRDLSSNVTHIPKAIFTVEVTPLGELYLHKIADKFEFDFKVYGLESDFIKRALKTYQNTTGNLGMLLNGVKGTGKTITAEMIANEVDQPIILITTPYNGINSFLSSITQNITVFIDEYEKVYKGRIGENDYGDEDGADNHDSTLLSLMDGALKTKWRKLFLLTTNRTYVNDNLLNRPGRLLYLKNFSDLTRPQIEEILDDCLEEAQFREDIITYLKPLKIITVDIVKSVVREVNIHKEGPDVCCKDLNVEFRDETYNMVMVTPDAEKKIVMEEGIAPHTFLQFQNTARVNFASTRLIGNQGNSMYTCSQLPDFKTGIYKVFNQYDTNKKIFEVRFEKVKPYHSVFV